MAHCSRSNVAEITSCSLRLLCIFCKRINPLFVKDNKMTPKTLLPVLGIFVCCFTSSFAQDTAIKHKIGSAVTVVFPGIPDTLSDRGVDGMYLNTEAISYVAVINRSEAMKGINTKREFKRALENAVDGYRRAKNLQGFSHQTTDTVIGGSEGQRLHFYNRPDDE